MAQGALLAASSWGYRKVFGGYSEVFGWFSGYSAHLDRLMMWQLIGLGYVRVRPSTILYNIIKWFIQNLGLCWGARGSKAVRIL